MKNTRKFLADIDGRQSLSKRAVCLLLALFVGLAFLASAPALALDVKNVRMGAHPDKTRIVIETSEPSSFKVFSLADPWRAVIDMPTLNWQAGAIDMPGGVLVKDIRAGAHSASSHRVVFDIGQPFQVSSVFRLPPNDKSAYRLVIDLKPADGAYKTDLLSTSFGEFEAGQATAAAASVSAETAPAVAAKVSPPPVTTVPSRKPSVEKPLIVIDAGHGGVDPGAVAANGLYEKNITLRMAQNLRDILERSGRYRVKLTRDDDTYLRLHQRVAIARRSEADMFISIHADSINRSNVRGASIYTLSETASDKETAQLAMRENRADLIAGVDLSVEDEDVVNILVDLAMRDTMNQSKFFANTVVDTFQKERIKLLQNPHRYAGFAVLKAPDMPSILVEMGFLSNIHEARQLNDQNFQRKLGNALLASIDAYFAKIRENERT